MTPNLSQIRQALNDSCVLREDEFLLPIWDASCPYGIGIDSNSHLILVLRPCNLMGNIDGSNFSFNTNCTIKVRGYGTCQNVSVLSVSSNSSTGVDIDAIAAVFLGLIEVSLDKSVDLSRVISSFEILFETGKSNQTSRETLVGLIGELLVILESKEKDLVLSCWHSGGSDRFDFSRSGERVEVKTTTAADRKHHFNSKQVPGPVGCEVVIASVMLSEVEVGDTLYDLVEIIKDDLESVISKAKLVEKTLMILTGPVESQSGFVFDIFSSTSSISYFSADLVPRPIQETGVISMEWEALMPSPSPIVSSGPLTSAMIPEQA